MRRSKPLLKSRKNRFLISSDKGIWHGSRNHERMKHIFTRSLMHRFRTLSMALVFMGASALQAAPVDCEGLAEDAAARAGIPAHLLPAIARAESGKKQGPLGVRAWPWTLNQGGKGMYFKTKQEALDYLQSAVKRGVRNIDVGCMQINYRWHGHHFDSLEQMLEPAFNTAYAAQFLLELRKGAKDWMTAASHYHSKTPKHANRYRKVVAGIMKKKPGRMTVAVAEDQVTATPTSQNPPTAPYGSVVVQDFAREGNYTSARRIYETNVVPKGTLNVQTFAQNVMRTRSDLPPALQNQWDRIEAFRADFNR